MTEDRLNLFCLVDGEPQSNAFSIKATLADTVDDLKVFIGARLGVDTLSKDLTLWRVSIPDNDDEVPILLGTVPNEDKRKLRATHDLLEVFPETPPKKTIHIIVQRPPSVSPLQRKTVPKDHITKELVLILQGVSPHHITHPVDPKDVEVSQRDQLGPFYKRPLPYHQTATDTSLVMLGLELDKQARTSDGKTLHSIVEGDVGSIRHRVVAMVAPSGSGKTATVIDLARKHFVVYCVCCSPSTTISPDFKDPNFITLAKDVERIYRNIADKKPGTMSMSDLLNVDSDVKAFTQERVEHEFLARLLFLQLLFNNNPRLEPQEFFREQTTIGGASTIRGLVKGLRVYDSTTINDMLDEVQTNLHSLLDPNGLGLVIALDEAQVAVTDILAGKLISPSALAQNRNDPGILFNKSQIQLKFRRGFLTPLSAALSNIQATLVILGTALSLQDADNVYSAVGKANNFTTITDFPQFDEDDVIKMLSSLVDLSDCDIPPAKRRKLSGRARFSIGIVNRLVTTGSIQDAKQATLDNAVDYTMKNVRDGLRPGIRTILGSDRTGEAARLLSRMVLAYHLQGGKISFSSSQQSDFVDKALCRLQPHPDGIHQIMDESIVIEAVEEELKALGKDPAFLEYMSLIYQIVGNFGPASSSKGDALEPLARRSLQRFNGFRLVDLPFLQGITLPKWCNGLLLRIDEINTASGFGYVNDLDFLTKCPPNRMLVAKSGTLPDGIWFFPDKRYAGSLAVKLYSSPVSQTTREENETSSDVRACFLQKDGISINPFLTNTRRSFEASGTPSNLRGILRIHVVLPRVQRGTPPTRVRKDPVTGVEDVMVYIDLSNMDSFFDESIAANKDDMAKLKRLIEFVSA
ncbi:hypothetical protein BGW39_002721 [Mortierella sp. 14UC]|nr:hypothetical protein BGW39_002721 [Mortierella sp. 14UC]